MTEGNVTLQARANDEHCGMRSSPCPDNALMQGNREVVTDHYFTRDVIEEPARYSFKVFIRLNARKKTRFEKVDFQHCIFDGCYINNCTFDSCVFTGCRFVGCNFHQTAFVGCTFDYATFERTQIDEAVLVSEAPREENLKMRFARSLRMNFSQIGDAQAVNRAISIELQATVAYLLKSWHSPETYYRQKYPGFKAVLQFGKWVEFWVLDAIWGNGESILKLMRAIAVVLIIIGTYDTIEYGDPSLVRSYWKSILDAPGVFLGVVSKSYPGSVLATIAGTRFVSIALLTALLVKRFGRR